MPIDLTQGFRFGAFTAEPLKGSVAGDEGQTRHLAPKAMDVLVRLAEAAPKPVTREDLINAVWGERYVSDEVLTHAIKELRHALGDSPTKPQYIQTIPKRGYRLLRRARPIADPTPVREGSKRRYRIVAASLLLLLLALGRVFLDFGQDHGLPDAGPEADDRQVTVSGISVSPSKSIVVLPFADLSPEGNQEYFADGLSEELRGALSQLAGLRVISRTSSVYFRGKNYTLSDIADSLRVAYVVEGSVRRGEDAVRITVRLVRASDDAQIWSRTFDRILTTSSLLDIQNEIARVVTTQLRISLTESDKERLARIPTDNMDAYEAYLLGRHRLKNRKVAELAGAVEQFSLAIELDPQFADAYAGLADACLLYDSYTGGQSNELCPSSLVGVEQLARKALELDPESAEAWTSLGSTSVKLAERMHGTETKRSVHERLNEALAAYERALELNPTLSEAYRGYGFNLMWFQLYPDPAVGWLEAWRAGRWEMAFDKGLEIDPLSIPLHAIKSWYPITVSSKEQAKWHGHRMIEIAPDSPRGYETVADQEWGLNGRIDESIRWLTKAMELDPQRPGSPIFIGLAYSALGDPDMALAYFDLAKALTAPDNEPAQKRLLVKQAVVRLVSGKIDAHQVAALPIPLVTRLSAAGDIAMQLGVFVDLATGRPADALARLEVFSPACIGATETRFGGPCPSELVRVYQELGDHKAAQVFSDPWVRHTELFDYPVTWWQFDHAGAFATMGRTDAALKVLENLVSSGWRGDSYNRDLGFILCCDVRFDAIRDHERFRAIAATIKADMAQQLENVRAMERNGEIPTLEEVKALIASKRASG